MVDWSEPKWEEIIPKVQLFAHRKLNKLGLSTAGGKGPEDFAQEACEKILSGARTWNQQYNLLANLCLIVSSTIYWEVGRCRKVTNDELNDLVDGNPSPEDEAIYADAKARLLEFLGKKDPVLRKVAELLLDEKRHGISWDSEKLLFRELNLSKAEAMNLRRRLERIVRDYLRE
jgi:DNA-directed RNA polymerase specialized sigma24 family protein